MSLDSNAIINAILSHSGSSGLFEQVQGHEPKSAPRVRGLTTAVFLHHMRPLALRSGLAATSAYVIFIQRLYTSMLQEPQDAIDPNMLTAADTVVGALTGDFTLGGTIAEIDLLGQYGEVLRADSGYLDIDNKKFRVIDIFIPCVINDAWTQAA